MFQCAVPNHMGKVVEGQTLEKDYIIHYFVSQ
jgi:hypothetical protein